MRYSSTLIIVVLVLALLAVGCTSSPSAIPTTTARTSPPTSPPITKTSTPTVMTNLPTSTFTSARPSFTVATPSTVSTLTAQEARDAVQNTLDMTGNIDPITDNQGNKMGWPKLPNGKPMPTNGQAGTPELTTIRGITVYEVPVLSDGQRVGEMYVNRTRSAQGAVGFVGGGANSPSGYSVRTY